VLLALRAARAELGRWPTQSEWERDSPRPRNAAKLRQELRIVGGGLPGSGETETVSFALLGVAVRGVQRVDLKRDYQPAFDLT
jgi:hypothetical protein